MSDPVTPANLNLPNRDHAEAVKVAIERKEEHQVKNQTRVDPVQSAILRADTALEGAIEGRVPDGDLIGFPVSAPVSNAAGVILLQTGEVISQESLERASLTGAMNELMAAIENPALGKA
jgi:hypothetical protein